MLTVTWLFGGRNMVGALCVRISVDLRQANSQSHVISQLRLHLPVYNQDLAGHVVKEVVRVWDPRHQVALPIDWVALHPPT
eukprot:4804194-Amphidinium_carterae.1